MPLVSVIVPVFNDEDTIEVCLRTLIRQTYSKKEIIVIDDGSTDKTKDVLSKMAKENPSLQITHIEHGGIAKARNTGLKLAKGEIVFFGEGDAVYQRDYVRKAVDLIQTDSKLSGVCLTGAPWITKSTIITKCIGIENQIQRKLLRLGKIQPFYTWIFWKKITEKVGGYDEHLFQGEDKDFFFRVKKDGYSIGLVNGINWRHKRSHNIWSFTKRNYTGAKTRILYLLKHHKTLEIIRDVGLLWFLVLALPLVLFFPPLVYLISIVLFLAVINKLVFVLRFGWDIVGEKRYLCAIPFFSLLRYMASAMGYSRSLIIILFRKLGRKPTDWSDLM